MLDVFIDCIVDQKYTRLVKKGTHPKEEIDQAWQNLFFEYCDLSGSKSYRQLFNIRKDIAQMTCRLTTVQLCVTVLRHHPVEGAKQELRKQGYDYKFDHLDPVGYDKDLNAVSLKSRTIEITLQERQHEYDKALEGYGGKQLTRHDFDMILVELSKYMGYQIKPKETTVSEYLAVYQKYEREAHQIEMMQQKVKK